MFIIICGRQSFYTENIRELFDTATLVLIYIYGIFEIEFLWGNMH